MRVLTITLLAMAFVGPSAFAEFDGGLASYDQLMAMTSQKRMQYIKGVRELMVMMEKQEQRYERASYSPYEQEFREKFTAMIDLFQILPEALAQETATVLAPDTPPSNCTAPKFNCTDSDDAAKKSRDAAIQQFRKLKGDEDNVCISGGFFSSYKNPALGRVKGGCKIPNQFPFPTKAGEKPIYTCPKSNQALCNPLLYCLHIAQDDNAPLRLHLNCEAYGGSAGDNITERCDQWYNRVLQQKTYTNAAGVTAKIRPCDPAEKMDNRSAAGGNQQLSDGWNDLKASLEKNYQTYCMKNKSSFQALFCNECDKMGSHIYAMNKQALGGGCRYPDPSAVPISTTPAAGGAVR